MMGGKEAGLIPIPTSNITINTVYITVKVIVKNILRNTYMYCTITPTITSFVSRNNIINMKRSTRYTKQSNMVTWVTGGIVAGLGYISTSPITTNSFSNITRRKVPGIFRPISMSVTIKSYITPKFTIITTYISPPNNTITTDITLLRYMATLSS